MSINSHSVEKIANDLIEGLHHAATSNVDPTDYARIAERRRWLVLEALKKAAALSGGPAEAAAKVDAYEIILNDIAEAVGIETPYGALPDAVRTLKRGPAEADTARLDELERTKCYPFWSGHMWVYIVAQDRSSKIERRGTGSTIREAIDAAKSNATEDDGK